MVFNVPRDAASAAPVVIDGLSAFEGRYDALLCDLWGVMHDGRRAFAQAVDAVTRFRAAGGTVVFITNSPRPREAVREQITGLGVPPDAHDGIVTSGDVTIAAIVRAGDRRFHHIGPPRDLALFEAVRAVSGVMPCLTDLGQAEMVIVTGLFDDRAESPADYAVALAAMRRRDLPMVCANPDIVVHIGDKLIYCGGALAEAYRGIGGRTVLAGKPHPPIYETALALASERAGRPLDRRRVLAIGDSLDTDVAGAVNEGLDVLFVTSGIHRGDFHPDGGATPGPPGYGERLAGLDRGPAAAIPFLKW